MAGRFSAAQVSSGPDKSPMKTIVTGSSGVGKTYFISTIVDDAGGPIFFLPVEEGAKGLCPDAGPHGFRVGDRWIAPRTLADFYDACDEFQGVVNAPVDNGAGGKRRPYRHFGVDSLTGLEDLVLATACQTEGVPHMEAAEYKKIWNAAMPIWKGVQNKLDEIRRSGVNIWLIAHATEGFDASETTGEVFRKRDLMLRGSGKTLDEARNMWRGWTDNVFFLSKTVSVAKGTKDKRAMAKLGGRVLITRETGNIYAKSRLPIPEQVAATWPDLQKAMRAKIPVNVDKTREQVAAIAAQLPPEERVSVESDLAAAKTPTLMAAALSRAQGMLAMVDAGDDEGDATTAATSKTNGAAPPATMSDEERLAAIDRGDM
jgi:hypothetical protein